MVMTYNSLIAAKGSPGAIMTWVNYTKLAVDIETIVDEAQALLWTLLRCREMRSTWNFTIPVGNSMIALPTGFLDPIGDMYCPSVDMAFRHKDEGFLQRQRNYNETNGSLGTDPFTTTIGSTLVSVFFANHGFNQESQFYTTGAAAFNGVTITGTFPVASVTDTNNFVIDITSLGSVPTASGSGGGGAVIYTCDILTQGSALWWAIYDESIHFDCAFDKLQLCQLLLFKSPTPLSPTVQTNFVTARYPFLMRQACIAQCADWMKEKDEYQKCIATLTGMVDRVSGENDMMYRGAVIDTETP